MTEPNVVGQMIAYGEMELTPAALRQPSNAQPCHTEMVDTEQEEI